MDSSRLLGSNPIETPSTRRNVWGNVPPPQSPLDAICMPREMSFSFGAGSFGMSRFGCMETRSHEALVYG